MQIEHKNWTAREFLKIADRVSRKLERGEKVYRDEIERLKLLAQIEVAKKKDVIRSLPSFSFYTR